MCKTLVFASIMCPSFCIEEPQPCDTTPSESGTGSVPFVPTPLYLGDLTGGNSIHEPYVPLPPRMPEIPPDTPAYPPPENPPTTVVPEPSSIMIMATVAVIGLLTMRKKK